MVLKIPFTRVEDVQSTDILEFELHENVAISSNFLQKFNNVRSLIKLVVNNVAKNNFESESESVILLTNFLLTCVENFELAPGPESKQFETSRYSVKKQLVMKKQEKVDLLEKINKLQNYIAMKNTHPSPLKVDIFFILHQAICCVEQNQDKFTDFVRTCILSKTAAGASNGHITTDDQHHQDPDQDQERHCFVCGSPIQPGPYSFYSDQVASCVCQKCIR